MMMLWRLITVWLVLAIVCRYPNCHVGCTEQLQDSPPPPPQDVSQKEGTDDQSGAHKADETLEPHVQPLSEDELLIEGDEEEEWVATQGQVEEEEQNVEALATVEAEQELMGELERAAPDSSTEAEDHPPPSSITQEHPTASPLQPSPEPSHPAGDGPEDAPSTTTSQDHTVNSVSEDPTLDEAPVEPDDGDKATADCEAGDTNPFDNASPPVILENTSNAHSAGTKTHTDPSLSPQAGPVTPGVGQTMNTSHTLKEKGVVEMEPSVPTKEPEDIPTFDEWKRKVMEVEKEKTQATHSSSSGSPHPVKKVQKNFNNYASVECGAKILGSNPEAKSTSAILMENMDLYMLNPCSNKIWFIIELCEPIQLKQLDIANFELFSSTPKDFLVSISDRYPTNKWLKLGTFHGRDERTVQSFPLDEHLYAKYVKMFAKYMKVELVSHFGSEHFCPLSLIRVFGTSMVEEYEEIADPSERPDDPDDDLDYVLGSVAGEDKSPKNLIGSAKDVILNMVNNIAVNVLGGGQDMDGNFSTQELNMTDLVVEFNTTDVTAALNLSIFDTEEADGPQDLDIPVAEIPPSEAPPQEPPATPETPELQLPAEEDKFITGLHEEEEESISSTITLLDKEDEDEVEEREEKERRRRQQESSDYCSLSPPLSSSSSSSFPCSSCSCSASLQEYLHRQCSALVSKTRERQVRDRESATPPDDGAQATAQRLPPFDSTHPTPQEPPIHTHQPEDREPTPALDLREDVSAELVDPPKEQARAEEESGHVLLEPSMTCAIPTSTTRTPVTTTPTPTAELPHLPTTDLQAKEPRPEKSQEVQAEEEQTKPTTVGEGVPPTPASNEPGAGATVVEQTWPLLSPVEDKPEADVDAPKPDLPVQGLDPTEHLDPPVPNAQQQPGLPAEPENKDTVLQEASPPNATAGAEQEASADTRAEDHAEDVPLLSSSINGQPTQPPSQVTPTTASASPAHSDFYAENSNGSEAGNGNQVPTSSQKESVFMRLNNRIKALEMNMSLSGRYLEQLSQRYRKQMEEMQKAFNKTIIKLQNTSRIAEEQDQRQTESIQSLHGQLENITQLVLNLSVRVSQLQTEVSDRQSYLLLCLVLCLILGLFLCVNHCRMSDTPTTSELDPPVPKSYSYCCPEREFTSFDDMGLTRRASYPLLQSESYLLTTTDGPQLHIEEAQRCSPANRRKKRGKMKPSEKVETLRPSYTAPELTNGTVVCNGTACTTHPTYPALGLLHPAFRDSPSEGSSEASSHSDDPSFCGIATACTRLCDGLPPPRTRSEKRALRRKRSKPTCMVVDLPQAPRRDDSRAPGVPNPQDLVAKNKELNSGTFGASIAL